ncbi:MAG: lysylphosphatidylglycerol synthase transmembrane domain-containing protein [Candidatus Thermoplasmatota archaeon]
MVKQRQRYIKKGLPLIGIILLLYLVSQLDIHRVINELTSINLVILFFSVFLTIPLLCIRTSAWRLIQDAQNIQLSFVSSMKILLIGFFYGIITPGYLGQVMRIPYMREQTQQPYGKLFVNVVLEVIVHNISLYLMMIVGSLLVVSMLPNLLYITLLWLMIVSVSIVVFIRKERGERFFSWLILHSLPKKYQQKFVHFTQSFYLDFPNLRKLLLPGFLGVFTWIIVFTQEYLVAVAVGAEIPYLYFLLLYPIANTAGFIPITFAGLGTREFTAVFLFSTLFTISAEKIFVFTILGFVITEILLGFAGFLVSFMDPRITTHASGSLKE